MKTLIIILVLFVAPVYADSYYQYQPPAAPPSYNYQQSYDRMIDRRDAREHNRIMEQEARRTNDYLFREQVQRQEQRRQERMQRYYE